MKISFSSVDQNLTLSNGYGLAGYNMVRSLQRLGHYVPYKDKTAAVQVHFSQPQWRSFFKGQYKIIYTPWESTALQRNWEKMFNSCDEVWTTSEWVKKVYEDNGVTKPIRIYEHGCDPKWTDAEALGSSYIRHVNDPLTFLHVGAPAVRKRADLAVKAFRAAFGDSTDVQLTIKSYGGHHLGKLDYNNVVHDWRILTDKQLNWVYNKHDVIVYPSMGEGFGLTPLQGLALAKPVICTGAWAPYRRFLSPELVVHSQLIKSPFPKEHPGKMYEPSFDSLVNAYREAYEHYDDYRLNAKVVAGEVLWHYNWDRLTKERFAPLVEVFKDRDTLVNQ